MEIDKILFPVESLGPGKRLVIWTVGCSKHCYKCISPELWDTNYMKEVSLTSLISIISNIINNNTVDGVTISGGDPFEQMDELVKLLPSVKNMVQDILVYTGYKYLTFKNTLTAFEISCIEDNISVLIDGPYVDELNDNKSTLIGSTNQNIYFFDYKLQAKYSSYLKKGRYIENLVYDKRIFSIGIHNKEE